MHVPGCIKEPVWEQHFLHRVPTNYTGQPIRPFPDTNTDSVLLQDPNGSKLNAVDGNAAVMAMLMNVPQKTDIQFSCQLVEMHTVRRPELTPGPMQVTVFASFYILQE